MGRRTDGQVSQVCWPVTALLLSLKDFNEWDNRILEPGLAVLIPIIDKIQYVKSLKENAIEIPSQAAITADNVTLEMDVCIHCSACFQVKRLTRVDL